jgi:hypothetical protein
MGKRFPQASIVLIHVSVKSLHREHGLYSNKIYCSAFHLVIVGGLRKISFLSLFLSIIILWNFIEVQFLSFLFLGEKAKSWYAQGLILQS